MCHPSARGVGSPPGRPPVNSVSIAFRAELACRGLSLFRNWCSKETAVPSRSCSCSVPYPGRTGSSKGLLWRPAVPALLVTSTTPCFSLLLVPKWLVLKAQHVLQQWAGTNKMSCEPTVSRNRARVWCSGPRLLGFRGLVWFQIGLPSLQTD